MERLRVEIVFLELDAESAAFQSHRFLTTSDMCTRFLAIRPAERVWPSVNFQGNQSSIMNKTLWKQILMNWIGSLLGPGNHMAWLIKKYWAWMIQWSLKSAPWPSVSFSDHSFTQFFSKSLLFVSTMKLTVLST